METDTGKVFGLCLSRTGTTSLHAALVLMGLGSVHYPLCYRNLARHWLAADFSQAHTAPFRCYSDLPTPVYFRELDESHPGSKFVLTLRDSDAWADSIERQYARPLPPSPKNPIRHRMRELAYGSATFGRDRYLDAYRRHNDTVRDHFAARPDALLELDLSRDADAWAQLAGFLARPATQRPFPHLRVPDLGDLSWVTQEELPEKQARMTKLVAGT
jgi:hypothetical protein